MVAALMAGLFPHAAAASVSTADEPALARATAGTIIIEQAYSHPTAAPGVPGVGFLTLTNTGKKADRLLAVTSPAAGSVEIHQSKINNGVMQMRAITAGVALPVGKTVAFAAEGLHLMLFSLHAPLVDGERVPVTLVFQRAGMLTTDLQVQPRQPPAPSAQEDTHQHQHHH